MATFAARLSADPMNGLSFGSDGGLYGTTVATPKGGTYGFTIDNSVGAAGQAGWYQLPCNAVSNPSLTGGYLYLWPLMLSRPARLTGAVANVVTAGTGSTVYNTLYAANTTTSYPGTKIIDWFNLSGATTGLVTATVPAAASTTVLAGFTLYWVATWGYTTSGYPSIYMRSGSGNMVGTLPRLTLPTTGAGNYNSAYLCLQETTGAWQSVTTGPASMAGYGLGGTVANVAPHYQFQFTNA